MSSEQRVLRGAYQLSDEYWQASRERPDCRESQGIAAARGDCGRLREIARLLRGDELLSRRLALARGTQLKLLQRQRHLLVLALMIAHAPISAHPTCSDGMAATWLAVSAMASVS